MVKNPVTEYTYVLLNDPFFLGSTLLGESGKCYALSGLDKDPLPLRINISSLTGPRTTKIPDISALLKADPNKIQLTGNTTTNTSMKLANDVLLPSHICEVLHSLEVRMFSKYKKGN